METAEVVIIGAGVIGTSIAYHLTRKGCHDVVVVERDAIGSGSTGRCAGGIRQQFSSEINVRLSTEAVKFFEHFEEETGHPADFRQHGYLMLATTEEEMAAFRQNVALQRSLGVEVYLVSPQQAKEIVPQLSVADILGATYCPSDGYADPYSVTQAFASCAKRLGARIYEQTEAVGIRLERGRVRGVVTSKGEVETLTVINAAGAYAAQIGDMVGLDIPVSPTRRHLLVSAPLHDIRRDSPMIVDFHTGFWLRREGPGVIFGMRNPEEQAGFDISVDWGFLPTIAEAACHRVPLLASVGLLRGQAGLHEDTPDYHAILGGVAGVEGLICACGFSGHGFMHSPIVGRLVAELVIEGRNSVNISCLALERFSGQTCPEKVFV